MAEGDSWLWKHIVPITAFSLGALLGPLLGLWLLPAEWAAPLRLAWGLLGGLGCALILTANRILGGYGSGEW